MNPRKLVPTVIFVLGGLTPLPNGQAQAPPAGGAAAPAPEDVALDALRTRADVSEKDPTIEAWITYRLNKLVKDLNDPSVDAPAEFIKAYQTQAGDAANSPSFKNRLAEQSGKRFAVEFQKGPELEPTVGMALARVLLGLESVTTLEGLAAGLRSTARPTVRYYCAKALATLVPAIQADQGLTASTLQLLREAGSQESSGVVLGQIYEALFYKEKLSAALPAILDVIQAQLRRREKDSPGADGAVEVALAFIRRELASIQDKNRLVAVLALQLRVDVSRYGTQGLQDAEKHVLERTIDAAEALLVQIVAPPAPAPNVRDVMKKLENQDINMPLELNKWIGTAQNSGVLNGPPWNVPIGAPVPE